ncbi:glycosyltransferase family 4 protein [Sphingomonas oleivorans]|nr:glycosyltransferase family 4 protein [Sphingomonas oleivorans]
MSASVARREAIILSCEYPPFPGGTGSYAGNLVEQLRAAGVRTTAIVPDYPDLPQRPAPDTHRILRHHKIAPATALKVLRLLMASPRSAVFLAADIRSVLLASLFSRLTGRPYRVMVHGSEAIKFKRKSLMRTIVRAAYCRSEMVSTNSAATLAIFEDSFGHVPQGKVNYLGVDEAWFAPPPETFENVALAALPQDARIVVTVGRIEDRKGQLETVQLLADAQARHGVEGLVYIVAGRVESDDYADQVKAAAAAAGVRLILTGRLSDEDIRLLYKRALAHILCARPLPTKIEGFGLVLVEAGAQHCPSIASHVGGIPEVVGEDSPLLFAPEALGAMADAVAALARDPAWRAELGAAAFARARGFNWRACAEGTFPELLAPAGAGQ